MTSIKVIITTLALLLSPFVHANQPPKPFTALYKVKVDGITMGEMKRSLSIADNQGSMLLQTELYTTGFISMFKHDRFEEKSLWRNGEKYPLPINYTYLYTNGKKSVFEQLNFQWDEGLVQSERDGKVTPVPIEPGTLDKLVYQMALRKDVAAGKKEINYEVADRGDIRTYRFIVHDEEPIKTPMGTYNAIKVERLSHNKERKTFLWYARELDYFVVKIVQDDDGHTFTSYLQSMSFN